MLSIIQEHKRNKYHPRA